MSRGRSCRDVGQHGENLGHPGKSATGGTVIISALLGTVAILIKLNWS